MQTITVDMTPGFRQPTIHYSQNDVGTTFAIDLRSRFGDTLPASPTVKIQATKPSGFGFSIEADSVVGSLATFTTVDTMTDEAGRFQAELQIIKDAVVIYTANFYMEGEANPHPIGTTDGSQETIIPTLTLLVERVEAAAASVLDMTVNATTLAAGSQATYSYDEDTNTATFGIPQGEAGAGAAGVTASAYSSSKTYAVGDYVIHNSNLYRCTTAITTAEAFTAAHWTQVVLGDDVSDLKSDINAVEDMGISSTSFVWIDGDLGSQGQDAEYPNYKRVDDYIPSSLLSITMNGATGVYVCTYNSAKAFISKTNITTDTIIDPSTISGCAYYRFATRDTNVPLLKFKMKSDIVMAVEGLQSVTENAIYTHSIRLADNYERGTIVSSSGELAGYGGFTNFRTGKYLRVKKGSNITATFPNGSMYVARYASDKSYLGMVRVYSATEASMGDDAVWLRFEHDGYVIGDTVTLAFESPDIVPYWGYGKRVNGNTISFGYQVYPCFETDTPTSVATLPTTNVFTSGVLMLPPNYKEEGEKVPIIYFAHGSADYFNITATEFSSSYMDYLHYLRDEGYALFDCYGWTNYYTISGAQMANPTNMAAIKQGLKWCADHYNIDLDKVYVTGKSLGGLQAINMCYEGDFHIKACCPLAPALDATEIGFGYDVASRKSYAQDLHFSEDIQGVLDEVWSGVLAEASAEYKAYAKANADKLLGYNPLWRNLIDVDAEELIQFQIDGEGGTGAGQGLPNKIKTMMRICPTPTKIICAVDDNAVSYGLCEAYVQSIKNCGGLAEMRALPANTGKHHAVDNADAALKVSSITTKCGVTYSNVPLAYAEMVQYFRRFS